MKNVYIYLTHKSLNSFIGRLSLPFSGANREDGRVSAEVRGWDVGRVLVGLDLHDDCWVRTFCWKNFKKFHLDMESIAMKKSVFDKMDCLSPIESQI